MSATSEVGIPAVLVGSALSGPELTSGSLEALVGAVDVVPEGGIVVEPGGVGGTLGGAGGTAAVGGDVFVDDVSVDDGFVGTVGSVVVLDGLGSGLGFDSPPHAVPNAANNVRDKDRRTIDAFLMVYSDERYPEPLPMQHFV